MKRLVLVFGILASVVSVGMGAMSEKEWHRHNCFKNNDKSSCQRAGLLIGNMTNNDIDEWMMNGHSCINKGDKNACKVVFDKIQKDYGTQYCSDSVKFCSLVASIYYTTGDFFNANKYYEILCNKLNESESCSILGSFYSLGQGVRQNYSTAKKYFGKACDLGQQSGCEGYKLLHSNGVQ